MSDITQLLQQVAAQLQQEGKTPSLALFRSRLAGQVAPQQLFAAYQQWRSHPVYADIASLATTRPSQPAAHNTQDATVTAQLARIEAKLDLLLQKLDV